MTQEFGLPAPPLAWAHLAGRGRQRGRRLDLRLRAALVASPSPRTCHWNCRARAGHEKPDGGRRGCGGGERRARARESPGREQGVRVLVCSLAAGRRSPRQWEGQGRACAGHMGAGRGLGRGRAAGEGWRRGLFEPRGRGRAQQLLPEHFLTQQSPCAGRAAPGGSRDPPRLHCPGADE